MSIKAKEYHGPEMKCMGAPHCSDCKEKQELFGFGLTPFGVQSIFVPRGADLSIDSLEGALNIIESNGKLYTPFDLNVLEPSETTIGCICTNCGHKWSEEITAHAVKNSLYERYSCTNCNPVSGAV